MKKLNIKKFALAVLIFTLGIVTSGLTISYAATTLSSKNVYYDNSTSGGSSSNVSGAIDELYATADDQDILKAEIKSELIDIIYPVGSIFMTTDKDNYGTAEQVNQKIGGTWERYATDRTLVGYKDSGNEVNYTNGSKTVEILEENLPSHSHKLDNITSSGTTEKVGNHAHRQIMYLEQTGYGHNIPATYAYFKSTTNSSFTYSTTELTNRNRWYTGYTELAGEHSHDVTITTNTGQTTGSTGSNKEINVQDPYIVVYMYKRTA